MNYLAHLFLSGTDPEIIYGNLLEDFMNGRVDHPRNNHLSERVKDGVRLHRYIDTFTDNHPLVKEAKNVFSGELGRYASVAIDVVFDHFLIKNWATFASEEFELFRLRIYGALSSYNQKMPQKLQRVVDSMIEHDWLKGYAFHDGLEKAFLNLNSRISDGPDMTRAIDVMNANYDFIDCRFVPFFSEISNSIT